MQAITRIETINPKEAAAQVVSASFPGMKSGDEAMLLGNGASSSPVERKARAAWRTLAYPVPGTLWLEIGELKL